jgi:hypothetical protein
VLSPPEWLFAKVSCIFFAFVKSRISIHKFVHISLQCNQSYGNIVDGIFFENVCVQDERKFPESQMLITSTGPMIAKARVSDAVKRQRNVL